jgi:hypothetical protein
MKTNCRKIPEVTSFSGVKVTPKKNSPLNAHTPKSDGATKDDTATNTTNRKS